jgi:iron(III) transport system permease protein
MTRAAVAGLQQASEVLENAASSLGAGPMRVAWRITLPMVSGHLVAGAMLAFAFSMLEVSDSLLLAQQANYYPLTKTIYELVRLLGDGRHLAAALGVWSMFFLAAVLSGAGSVLGRRLGVIFRV